MDHRLRQIADYFLACKDRKDVDPTALGSALLPHIYVLRVERLPPQPLKLRVSLTGTSLDTAFGRSLNGQFLESFLHGPRAVDVVRGFHHCADTREPVWMRQVARVAGRLPRYVEGVAIYLEPGYIYGGLVMGEFADEIDVAPFERISLQRRETIDS
ncbi:MAG TPA: hypothetical protein VNT30_17840 [Stellaceae bacterium]|nr:hypothetical protein [Stellaceae bacterium]